MAEHKLGDYFYASTFVKSFTFYHDVGTLNYDFAAHYAHYFALLMFLLCLCPDLPQYGYIFYHTILSKASHNTRS